MGNKARAIPKITMTPGLDIAIAACAGIPEVRNAADPAEVREAMARVSRSFEDPTFFYADAAADETKALETIIKVATLYLEHIRAGNLNDRKD